MKINNIIFSVIVYLLFIPSIYAYNCHYDATIAAPNSFASGEDIELDLKIDTKNKTFTATKVIGISIAETTMDSYIDPNWTDEKLIEYMNGGCFGKIYLCKLTEIHVPGESYIEVSSAIINPDLYNYLDNLTTTSGWRVITMNNVTYNFKESEHCNIAVLDEDKSDGKKIETDFPCSAYDNLWEKIEENYCNPNENNKDCALSTISLYNKAKENIKKYCQNIMKYSDYINPCVNACLKLPQELEELEGKTSDNIVCGFSGRLIIWIANIVRWIKYIIPVAVIVLGILDFIKAVGTDKDDEMKKAQGRFVKRLIAAALIFIVPFIIEFVLDKMGFVANGCGIIDL